MIRRLIDLFRSAPDRPDVNARFYAHLEALQHQIDVHDRQLRYLEVDHPTLDFNASRRAAGLPPLVLQVGDHIWTADEVRKLGLPGMERLRWRIWLERQADEARTDLARIVEAAYERAGLDFVPANIVRGCE